MPRFNNLAELDFFVVDIPELTEDAFETIEIEMPSDVDLENEAMIIYGIELIIQDSATLLATGEEFVAPMNFHLLEPQDENDLDTCFLSKNVKYLLTDNVALHFDEGHISPMVPIITLTSFWLSVVVHGATIAANDIALRIWYDDVPITQDKMASLVNLLRGEQV